MSTKVNHTFLSKMFVRFGVNTSSFKDNNLSTAALDGTTVLINRTNMSKSSNILEDTSVVRPLEPCLCKKDSKICLSFF